MKQSRVSAFARAARGLALAAVGLALGAGTLLGQGSTGKIEGRVRDQAGAPIANAQVFVVGTAFNALTNPQGYYFINNVPAGTISVRSAFIGYKSTQVDGVKVLAGPDGDGGHPAGADGGGDPGDHRRQPDPAAGAPGRGHHQAAHRRLRGRRSPGRPDQRRPRASAGRHRRQQRRIFPSVAAATTRPPLTLTGCRSRPATGATRSSAPWAPRLTIGTSAFEEASVTTGSSSAEFGNAKSGIVSIVTKTGGSQYQGSLGFETDEPFGVNNGIGFNRVEGGFSGPLAGRLTFALSGVLEGQTGGGRRASTARTCRSSCRRAWTRRSTRSACSRTIRRPPLDERPRPTPPRSTSTTTRSAAATATSSRTPARDTATTDGIDADAVHPGDPQQLRALTATASGYPATARTTVLAEREAELHLRHRLAALAQPGAEPLPRAPPQFPISTSTTCPPACSEASATGTGWRR